MGRILDEGSGSPKGKLRSLGEAAALVADGDRVGFGGQPALARRPMAFARELVRAGRSGLHVYNQIGGLEADLLIGAGAVATTNCAYVGLGDLGPSPHFERAAAGAAIGVAEYTEFTLVAGLRAASMDLPFMPWKTAWGSQVVSLHGWRTVACPYSGQELLAVPAVALDVAVIQVATADEEGNVSLPEPLEISYDFDYLVCRAARKTIVCAERIEPVADPSRVGLFGREVDAVVHAPGGAWPCAMGGFYGADLDHLRDAYLPAATASNGAFARYLVEHVHRRREPA
jgi:glutaconate CoA-transferase, subunit A